MEKWQTILALARQWGFIQVGKLCVRELEKLPIPPVEKIRIYQHFNLNPNLLFDSYKAMVRRPSPLDVEEGTALGLTTSLRIAEARERARASDDFFDSDLQDTQVQSVVKDVFGLQGSASAQVMNYFD